MVARLVLGITLCFAPACLGEIPFIDCAAVPDDPACVDDETTPSNSAVLPDAGPCAVPLSPLQIREDGDIRISNARAELRFDIAGDNGQATFLGVAGSGNLLYTGPGEEIGIGVGSWPTYHSWENVHGPHVNAQTYGESGPGIAFYSVEWTADNGATGLEGSTLFTVHPDGRILRDDNVRFVGEPGANDWFKTHIALVVDAFDVVDWLGGTEPGSYDVESGLQPGHFEHFLFPYNGFDGTAVCARDDEGEHVVGFGMHEHESWAEENFPIADGEAYQSWGVRASHVSAGGGPQQENLTMAFDWLNNGPPTKQRYYAQSMIFTDTRASDPCLCVEQQYRAYERPPRLVVDGGTVAEATIGKFEEGGDPDADGYYEASGVYGVEARSDTLVLELEQGFVPTFQVRIEELSEAPDDPAVFLDDALLVEGEHYYVTPSGTDEGFFLFLGRRFDDTMQLRVEV